MRDDQKISAAVNIKLPAGLFVMACFALMLGLSLFAQQSYAQKRSKQVVFIENMAQSGFAFLNETELSPVEKKAKFRIFLTTYFDTKAIGQFVIGKYLLSMNDVQKAEYFQSFETYLVNIYQRRFSDYKGQPFVVTRSLDVNDKDTTVYSLFEQNASQSIPIEWRVRKTADSFQVIDVVVSGVSMAINQRSDFSSLIQRNGGNVDEFLRFLAKYNMQNVVAD